MSKENLSVIAQKRMLRRPLTQEDLDELKVYLEEREANQILDVYDNEEVFLEMIRDGASPAEVQAILVII